MYINTGERIPPCLTPEFTLNHSVSFSDFKFCNFIFNFI